MLTAVKFLHRALQHTLNTLSQAAQGSRTSSWCKLYYNSTASP